jgi:hypothetical protein
MEFSGISTSSPDDGGATGTELSGSTSTNGDTVGSWTTTTNGDLILAMFYDSHNNTTVWTAGTTPLTFSLVVSDTTMGMAVQWGVQTTAGSINPAATGNTTTVYDSLGTALLAAGGGGGGAQFYSFLAMTGAC